jgi:A/G-specific adenine glycosylase
MAGIRWNSVAEDLLRWFSRTKEDLPWRAEPRDPYAVWVSEVMLQQTQVAAVVPYFKRWMRAFPTLSKLADAPQEKVLKAWEGLGYYSRARNLHKAAKALLKAHGGRLPLTPEGLRGLPGIGAYSAAAISSLAFGYPALVFDGNVRRVAARRFAIRGDVTEKQVRAKLEPLLPKKNPGAFNEALMELGRRICRPKNPRCGECPIRRSCRAYALGKAGEFPHAKKRPTPPEVRKIALVKARGGRLLLRQRPEGEMLGGLWGFPLAAKKDIGLLKGESLAPVRHAYSHFRITATPFLVGGTSSAKKALSGGRYFTPAQIRKLPLSTLDHKILESVREALKRDR